MNLKNSFSLLPRKATALSARGKSIRLSSTTLQNNNNIQTISLLSHLSKMAPSRTSPDPPSTAQTGLSKQQLSTFEQDGYLIIPNALDAPTISSLLTETHSLLENFPLADHPMTKFSTGDSKDSSHVGDDYFLTSGDKIRFFFEEGTSPFLSPPSHSKNTSIN